MIPLRWLPNLLHFLVCIILTNSSPEKQPLIFNPYTLDIYNPQAPLATLKPDHPYAFACPPEEPNESEFVEKVTYRDEALFLRKYCPLQETNVSPIQCEENFKLSTLYNYSNKMIEFGFEVYFKKSKVVENFAQSDIRKFGWFTEAGRIFQRIDRWMTNNPADPWDPRKTILKAWNFVWLSKTAVRFEIRSWSLKSLKYSIYPVTIDQLLAKCSDYDLARNVYDSRMKLDEIYNESYQADVFSKVQLPKTTKFSCRIYYNCVRKYNLVAPHHYQASLSEPILCSDLTSIPLWHEIPEKFMNRMEIFFTAIAQVTGHKLEILTEVLDVLTLPSTDKNKPREIYLYKKKVPVPKIILKIVRYKLPNCDDSQQLCWFDVVIVIHNQTEIAEEDRLCPKNKCREWAWDSIQYLKTDDQDGGEIIKYENVYCCRLSEKIEKKIKFFKKGTAQSDDFNLRDFPQYDEDEKKIVYVENKHEEFKLKMNELIDQISESESQSLTTSV